jgi:hypothetical protein
MTGGTLRTPDYRRCSNFAVAGKVQPNGDRGRPRGIHDQNREIVARQVVRGALLGAAFLGAALFGARSASADIVYLVDEPIGVGSVVGTLTTDGHTGILSSSDFLAWNLTLNGVGASSTITSSDPTAAIELVGSEVVATPTKITFDFSGSDDGHLLFQDGLFSGMHYWCSGASASTTCFPGKTVTPRMIGDGTSINVPAAGVQTIASCRSPRLGSSWELALARWRSQPRERPAPPSAGLKLSAEERLGRLRAAFSFPLRGFAIE